METDTFDVSVSAEEKEEMPQIWNFSAGPGMLPRPVLEAVQREFLDYRGLGASIVEMSHRTHAVEAIVESLTDGLRGLLAIPEDFEIFFTQGGGRTQFAMVPANLLRGKTGAYLVTGLWSAAALEEARRIGRAEAVVRTEGDVPDATECDWPDAAYVYYCDNETVHGIEFSAPPMAPEGVPLVADMSSNFLTRPIDWSRHGVVWAAAQKNFAPAGLTVVIARRDLLGGLLAHMPSMFDWALYAREKSMPNTPPVFQLYIADLVAKWVRSEGGVEEMHRRALERSSRSLRHERGPTGPQPRERALCAQESRRSRRLHCGGRTRGLPTVHGPRERGRTPRVALQRHAARRPAALCRIFARPASVRTSRAATKRIPSTKETSMEQSVRVITIDGPAASGKGTVAERIAHELGFHYLDSGALYRLATYRALKLGTPLDDAEALERVASAMAPVFEKGRILLDGEDVTLRIRTEEVSRATSRVAAVPGVRKALFDLQRRAAKAPGLVADGRDMGTVVFPEADLKIFLTASARVRAERRALQLEARGEVADREALTRDLEERDRRDRERAEAPLKPAADAKLLDTSALGIEEVVKKLLDWWNEAR